MKQESNEPGYSTDSVQHTLQHPGICRSSRSFSPSDVKFLSELSVHLSQSIDRTQPTHCMISGFGAGTLQQDGTVAGSLGTPPLLGTRSPRLISMASTLVAEFCPQGTPTILSIRILSSPPGVPSQQWHLDYSGRGYSRLQTRTVFVGLTPATADNCTEVLLFTHQEEEQTFLQRAYEKTSQEVDQDISMGTSNCGKDQVIDRGCRLSLAGESVRSPQPLKMGLLEAVQLVTSRVIHRRSHNASNFTRLTLNIDYTPLSAAEVAAVGFEDDDYTSSQDTEGGVIGAAILDNLHSELVVDVV